MTEAWVMAIGGIDPSGGAGLAVDRRAIEAAGLACTCIVSADTDQDDGELRSLGARPGDVWLAECRSRVAEGSPCAVKFGLLPGREALQAAGQWVDDLLERDPNLPVVLDPVLRSSSGFEFVTPGDLPALLDLCRRPLVLTPNLPELAALTGRDPGGQPMDLEERLAAAQELLKRGPRAVIVKDGHGQGETICDWLCEGDGAEPQRLQRPRVQTAGGMGTIRGTGCRFASHLAAGLGLGQSLFEASLCAGDWVAEEISKGS